MTSELKNELQLLRMRGAFDTKRFYRTSDYAKGLPKFFQVGTVIEDPLDPAGSGGRRRPKTMVREALNDPKLRRRAKARFKKVRTELACPRRSRVPSRACAPRRCRRRRALGARVPPSRGPASGNPSPRASERRGRVHPMTADRRRTAGPGACCVRVRWISIIRTFLLRIHIALFRAGAPCRP